MLIQSGLSMASHKFWQFLEGGLMDDFGIGHHNKQKVFSNEETEKYVQKFRSILHKNNFYFTKFLMCEVFNFLILFINHMIIDNLLNGQFYYYGREIIKYYR